MPEAKTPKQNVTGKKPVRHKGTKPAKKMKQRRF